MNKVLGGRVFTSVVCYCILALAVTPGETVDLTIQVNPGEEECFHEHGTVNQTLTLDYMVTSASQGELDINFRVYDPYNRPIVNEFRKSDSTHSHPITIEGMYKICFDNTFSHFSVKTVAFGISIENEDEAHWREYGDIDFQPEGVYDVQIQDIQSITNRARVHLTRIQRIQEEFRELESRDRSVVEHNYERVNFWSIFNLIVVMVVGFLQVLVVKGLFDEKYGVNRVLRMASGKR